jgi:circadian clock protein KaiC
MPIKLAQMKRLKGASSPALEKAPTGIRGLDEISGGGLPRGRTTIVCGGPGCGKTMLGMEFLVRGIEEFGEPGVLLSFEETTEEITRNVASLGFDLEALVRKKKLFLDFLPVEPNDIQEAGDYDLEGLFIRLQLAVESVGAKRVVLDTLEALFSGFSDMAILRGEVRRLFRWLKERGLTAVVTAEQGEGTLTRHGLEEYVSDCVIFLDHRIQEQISTRRLRIVKYRGTSHSADEYPFLIDEAGLSVLPVTSVALNHKVSSERITTGIADLDVMLEGKGYYRGSSILVSGTAGSGKTTLACHFADSSCRREERCLLVGFEESTNQVFRNAATIGIDLNRWVKKGLLYPTAWRPTQNGMEMHLLRIHKLTDTLKPKAVILDPITNLIGSNTQSDVRSMLMRLLDFLKERGITALFTSLTRGGTHLEATEEQVSSLIDTWILLRDLEQSGERNRCLYILKSRGMAHSNQLREFVISADGIKLLQPYVGAGQVFTGSARLNQEARDSAEALVRKQNIERKQSELRAKRRQLEARIADLKAEYQVEEKEMELLIRQTQDVDQNLERDVAVMAANRRAETSPFDTTNRRKLNGAER